MRGIYEIDYWAEIFKLIVSKIKRGFMDLLLDYLDESGQGLDMAGWETHFDAVVIEDIL